MPGRYARSSGPRSNPRRVLLPGVGLHRGKQPPGLGQHDRQEPADGAAAVPTMNGKRVPSNCLSDREPDQRGTDGADDPLDRRGRAGDVRHMLHRKRAHVRRGEGEAGHRQRLQDDEDRQCLETEERDGRMHRGHQHERQRRRMTDTAQAIAPHDPRVEPRGERHRRRDRREHQADEAARVEGVEDDLLDRGDIGDQRGEADHYRQRVAA